MNPVSFYNSNPVLKDVEGRCQMAYALLKLEGYYEPECSMYRKNYIPPTGGYLFNPANFLVTYDRNHMPTYKKFKEKFLEAEGVVTVIMGLNSDDRERVMVGFDSFKDNFINTEGFGAIGEVFNAGYKSAEIAQKFVMEWNTTHRKMAITGAFN